MKDQRHLRISVSNKGENKNMTNKNRKAAGRKPAAKTKDAGKASLSLWDYSTFANPIFLCDAFQNDGMPC